MSATTALIARQRQAADPAASVWVSASAGTGKTHVLTDRVLRLLLRGVAPDRLLCLTFTRAAAAEMANRIHQELGAWATLPERDLTDKLARLTGVAVDGDIPLRARRLFARVLETPGGLKVQTIHAFCESLLGRFPLEADLPPHFRVLDERDAQELLATATARVLDSDSSEPAPLLAGIAALIDEAAFAALMTTLSGERGRLRELIDRAGDVDGLIANMRARLRLAPDDTAGSIVAEGGPPADPSLRRVAVAMQQGSKTDRARGAAIVAWLDAAAPDVPGFEAYARQFLKKDGAPFERLAYKETLAMAPDAAEVLSAEAARVGWLMNRLKAAALAEATAILVQLGARLIDGYEREKRLRAVLDYDDLILYARDLLRRPGVAPWVLYKLDGGLDHILIDEAQDTNPDQWQVIQALAEEFFVGEGARQDVRTVFAVGDPKQSIYSFQRADPRAFEAMREHFQSRVHDAQQSWRDIELALSFRSTPAVLDFVDQLFASEDARDGLLMRAGEIRHVPHRTGEAGLVELWPTELPAPPEERAPWAPPITQEPDDSPLSRLAVRIAQTIGGWLDSGELLEAEGRPIRPGDIMILVQRRGAFVDEMVRQLKLHRIAVAGSDRMVLSEQLAVMDLIALGNFLLLPDDDLTLAVVLKGPLIGFDEEALFALAHGREGSLWQSLRRRADEDPLCREARHRLSAWLARADFSAPYEFFAVLLGAEGGRRRLLSRLGVEANDAIDEFLTLALQYEQAHPPSLQGFLHWLQAGEAEVKRDLEQRRDEVRVMTVHGAKGLQAPIVFLPDTVRVPSQLPSLFWDERSVLWLPRTDMEEPVTAAARGEVRQNRDREYRRLLYVALTRARDRLYICGWENSKGRRPGCWYELAEAAISALGQTVTVATGETGWRHVSPQEKQTTTPHTARAVAAAAAPAWLRQQPTAEPRPPRPLTPSKPEDDDPPVRRPLDGADGRRFRRGTIIHRLLQSLPDLPLAEREAAARRYLDNPAHDLAPEARLEIMQETMRVLGDSAFSALFGPGSQGEVPIVGRLGPLVIAGQVDRLLVSGEEVFIVDYKTNRPSPEKLENVAESYLKQVAAYAAILASIYPKHSIRCALLWTDGPRLMELPHEILREHAP